MTGLDLLTAVTNSALCFGNAIFKITVFCSAVMGTDNKEFMRKAVEKYLGKNCSDSDIIAMLNKARQAAQDWLEACNNEEAVAPLDKDADLLAYFWHEYSEPESYIFS